LDVQRTKALCDETFMHNVFMVQLIVSNLHARFDKNKEFSPLFILYQSSLVTPYLIHSRTNIVPDDDQQPGHICGSLACDRILLCVVCWNEKD
jgi:hypothetical protein